ncbi:DEAD/DEAH box helicase family protein [Geomonas nitrogeniifigens]|uniref:DEAD/DEAH box helicase family protein n=1 Tax=Geomonas diazotrophica TaxID=2843197 RepID=UPI001C2C7940|nr:DEAD/DEAH box helicase family protein [Geomonas nitrogeniifigens]QXE88116.1 DEAD/DEAH box helicase family protein [Geomonas nitrogeniifigens]
MSEQDARLVINKKLEDSGWVLTGHHKNVRTEEACDSGYADYLLLGRNGQNLAVLEAKADSFGDVYLAKDQAHGYALAMGCRYVFLANSEQLYFWDLDEGDARPIERFISPEDLQRRADLKILKKPLFQVEHQEGIADRPYQKEASDIIARLYDKGKRAFLLEMATGTGKTRLAAAIIDRFLASHQAERILFIVDRIELAKQSLESFQLAFMDKYKSARYKPGRKGEWGGASVVVATIQSLNIHFKEDFTPGYFDLVINDECHRSIYGELPRQVVEYFQATRIGLTATPKDFLKNIDIEHLNENNPKALEYRMMRDTYKHFGCEAGEPTYRFTIQDATNAIDPGPYLVPAKIYKLYSLITRESVSDEGWNVEIDGEDYTFTISQLEKKVNVPERNRLICQEFLKYAEKTPDGAIGKAIFFAVSQDHAAALTKELNALVPESNGKFAEVITSRVKNASDKAKTFRKSENYWPRIAVTVDMLSTGYDCPEVLNIVLARPIASPTTYIQIKGRGTRKHTFPDGTEKSKFIIHDFCEVVEYFEEKYDYEAPLPIPTGKGTESPEPPQPPEPPIPPEPPQPTGTLVAKSLDAMVMTQFIEVGPEGEKVDRMLYQTKWKEKIQEVATQHPELMEAAQANNFTDDVLDFINTEVLNRPNDYFNETNLAKVYRIFADITDFIKDALGIGKLPTEQQQFQDLIDFLRIEYNLNLQQVALLKMLTQQLIQSPRYAEQFDKGDYMFLNNAPFRGAGVYLGAFGDTLKPIFTQIKQSPSFKLARMH